MSEGHGAQVPQELAQDNGEIWDGDRRMLENKLADWYGVDSLWLQADWYDDGADETLYDVLVLYDGEDDRLVAEDVPVFGHGPSGAAGVNLDDLPTDEELRQAAGLDGGESNGE